ncbi:MAG: hypothetical protein ABR970_20330 [Roseiarcus sp.]|jgi:hypothetical protein
MIAVLVLAALAALPPTTDPQRICQGAREAALPEERAGAFQSCVHDEESARDELKRRWTTFTAEARTTCAEPKGLEASYVEMLTCLEMESGANFEAGPQAPSGAGAPSVAPKP